MEFEFAEIIIGEKHLENLEKDDIQRGTHEEILNWIEGLEIFRELVLKGEELCIFVKRKYENEENLIYTKIKITKISITWVFDELPSDEEEFGHAKCRTISYKSLRSVYMERFQKAVTNFFKNGNPKIHSRILEK